MDIPSIVHLFKPQNNFNKKLSFCKMNKIDHIITPLPMYEEIEKKIDKEVKEIINTKSYVKEDVDDQVPF